MKWIGISGSWRATSAEVEQDVRAAVRDIMARGDGIVSGGALNVDYFATDEALKLNPDASHIKIFLPVTFERYAAHYRKRAQEGVITTDQAETLIAQLTQVKTANPEALIENQVNTECNPTTYFERNTEVVNASDELYAFIVNGSGGTQDTIDKAASQAKPVQIKSYEIA
ncbi:MAG TPA: hypothetical protein VEB18_02120 [Candidatus Paceibacterota bacterium]|nr:hypothetical protein [Candidatus Paceibacterota bacterium]